MSATGSAHALSHPHHPSRGLRLTLRHPPRPLPGTSTTSTLHIAPRTCSLCAVEVGIHTLISAPSVEPVPRCGASRCALVLMAGGGRLIATSRTTSPTRRPPMTRVATHLTPYVARTDILTLTTASCPMVWRLAVLAGVPAPLNVPMTTSPCAAAMASRTRTVATGRGTPPPAPRSTAIRRVLVRAAGCQAPCVDRTARRMHRRAS